MILNGDPAPNPPPAQPSPARVTLASCRERLRAAIRSLSLPGRGRPSADDPAAGPPPVEERRDHAGDAALRQDLQNVEQAYDDLITNISHDVKTSLTVIRGHAQMTARAIRRGDAVDTEALLATLKVIDSSALRISDELDGWIDDAGDRTG